MLVFWTKLCLVLIGGIAIIGIVRSEDKVWWRLTSVGSLNLLQVKKSTSAWGNVCDYSFTDTTAKVICGWMGFNKLTSWGKLGQEGSGPIYLYNLKCPSSATALSNCTHFTWGTIDCSYSDSVVLNCETVITWRLLRLFSTNSLQLLQVRNTSEWGTVCDDSFTNTTATVICQWLGFAGLKRWDRIGIHSQKVIDGLATHLDELVCPPTALDLSDCTHNNWGHNDCYFSENVMLSCFTQGEYPDLYPPNVFWRLYSIFEDTTLIQVSKDKYSWGNVCADRFSSTTADVLCKWMGYAQSYSWETAYFYAPRTDPTFLDEFKCPSTAQDISDCTHAGWGKEDCSYSQSVLLKCQLVMYPSSSSVYWRLNPVDNGPNMLLQTRTDLSDWGNVCDDSFSNTTADVICKWMGFEGLDNWHKISIDMGTDPIFLDELRCPSTAQDISDCTHAGWGREDCSYSQSVVLLCNELVLYPSSVYWRLREVEGDTQLVQLSKDKIRWGNICSDGFTDTTAGVICKWMGFEGFETWDKINSTIGNGSDSAVTLLDKLKCPETSQDISDCAHKGWGKHNCSYTENVVLKCIPRCKYVEMYNSDLKGTFLKIKCMTGFNENDNWRYKCWNSSDFYTAFGLTSGSGSGIEIDLVGSVCSNDSNAYQGCNRLNIIQGSSWLDTFTNHHYCGHFFCGHKILPVASGRFCDGVTDCDNGLDEEGCEEYNRLGWFYCNSKYKRKPKRLPYSKVCDGLPDCGSTEFLIGEDEAGCDHVSGVECLASGKKVWVHPLFICENEACDERDYNYGCSLGYYTNPTCQGFDNTTTILTISQICNDVTDCMDGVDEDNCEDGGVWCKSPSRLGRGGDIGGRSDYNYVKPQDRCAELIDVLYEGTISLCMDFSDQMNCSTDLIELSCNVNSYQTTLSKFLVCNMEFKSREKPDENCDDGIDEVCEDLVGCGRIHKHKFCNGIYDCINGDDEKGCSDMANETCIRRGDLTEAHRIPNAWICDGVSDCVDNKDEDRSQWKMCGKDERFRCVSNSRSCDEYFRCPGDNKYIKQSELCDNIESCGGKENPICKVSQPEGQQDIVTTVESVKDKKLLSYCLPGLLKYNVFQCSNYNFGNMYEVFGVTEDSWMIPKPQQSCESVFGEAYVLLSCAGKCSEVGVRCPLSPVKFDSCISLQNKIISPSQQHFLSIVWKKGSSYHNQMFPCKNGQCVTYDKVCNLANDCGDHSDEENCINNFHCVSGEYIPIGSMCDGIQNCLDRSDECNEVCEERLTRSKFITYFTWFVGVSATLINLFVIIRAPMKLKNVKTHLGLMNESLVFLIAIGDFLIGLYLIGLGVADAVYGESYCSQKNEWLTSVKCSALGVVSTIGSQVSLFAMTYLSLYRIYSLRNPFYQKDVSLKVFLKTSIAVLVVVCLAAVIAIIPQLPIFEDYFMNGIFYKKIPLFLGPTDKDTHIVLLGKYYGKFITEKVSWQTIRPLVTEMFSQDNGTVVGNSLNFYGNDGVCLFKYFVDTSDPQWIFSSSIVVINFICFIVIMICYVTMGGLSVKSKKEARGGGKTQKKDKNLIALQRKITMIIVTDFLCWVPFVLACLIHLSRAIDATQYYAFFSIIVLPINSVINPILYNSEFKKDKMIQFATSVYRGSTRYMSRSTVITRSEPNVAELKSIEPSTSAITPA